MSEVKPWFERQFDFSFPAEMLPNVLMRLRGTPARLEETVRGTRADVLVRKEAGKWSAQEHAGHLLDLEPLWTARVEDFARGNGELTVADLQNRKTQEANHNARAVEEILSEFRRARVGLVDHAERAAGTATGKTLLHPRMKKAMRLVDHLYFVAEHDDHHLARIWEMVRAG